MGEGAVAVLDQEALLGWHDRHGCADCADLDSRCYFLFDWLLCVSGSDFHLDQMTAQMAHDGSSPSSAQAVCPWECCHISETP